MADITTLTDELDTTRLVREAASSFVAKDLSRIRKLRFQQPGFDRIVWSEICEMGWLGLRIPEEQGGAGFAMRDYCALTEELGAGLVPEPVIPAGLSARLLKGGALDDHLAGRMLVLPAWQEHPNRLGPGTATRFSSGKVTGHKVFVPMAAGADAFVVTTDKGPVLIRRHAPGLTLAIENTQDGGHFGTLSLEASPAEPCDGDPVQAIEEATLATAAYLLGVMERAFALALDYVQTRKQFGRALGNFQVLQHRLVDLKIQLSLSRASIDSAAGIIDAGAERSAIQSVVSRAKARSAEAASLITRQAVQLHGAIGYTDEADPGLFLRKAMVLANLFGSPTLHRARFAALTPEIEEE